MNVMLKTQHVYAIRKFNNAMPDVGLSQEGSLCFTSATKIQLDQTKPATAIYRPISLLRNFAEPTKVEQVTLLPTA